MRKLLLTLSAFFCFVISAMSQKLITGKVTNETGAPMAGVTISANNGSASATTNADGSYRITVSNSARALIFTSSESASATMNIGGRNVINVVLTSTTKSLEDVVITGYGTKRRSQYAGAASKVNAEAIN